MRGWVTQASCRYLDDVEKNFFFPVRSDSEEAAHALRICEFCPVIRECLYEQLCRDVAHPRAVNDRWEEIFGGTRSRERRAIAVWVCKSGKSLDEVFDLIAAGARPCEGDCGRLLRPQGVRAGAMPGTVAIAAGGMCKKCRWKKSE
ncbi:WhiB family transcriptional regulator [Schaalia sp. lx-260]|uniref:WhiB family transcriptional regulator n=1 Tax=Schaalia sp. lx-260 TaxID=2899082 RepID=UPI001E5E7179|nr:WhiB family transcriptional regulator [Schaalia sp. lx-260]MCD4549691.1 WhiB family transcriptional regulator [Schaalia sp. lx-260]